MENKDLKKVNDNFQPKVTLHNSFFYYLVGVIIWKPLSAILSVLVVLILFPFGITGPRYTDDIKVLVVDFSSVVAFILIVIVVTKIVKKKEIKKHGKELGLGGNIINVEQEKTSFIVSLKNKIEKIKGKFTKKTTRLLKFLFIGIVVIGILLATVLITLNVKSKNTPIISDIPSIVKEWNNSVALVDCYWSDSEQYGSGVLETVTGTNRALISTNKHVVLNDSGFGPNYCDIYLPTQPKIHIENNSVDPSAGLTQNYTNELKSNGEFFHASENQDFAMIELQNPSESILKTPTPDACLTDPDIGDKIIILGYPEIGSTAGITVTSGIISGIEGDYYVTDTKVDHGNSGGLTILVKDNCFLGIPTWVEGGQLESLARILKVSAFLSL